MNEKVVNQIRELVQALDTAHKKIKTVPTASTGYKQKVWLTLRNIEDVACEEPALAEFKARVRHDRVYLWEPYAAPQGCRSRPEVWSQMDSEIGILRDMFEATVHFEHEGLKLAKEIDTLDMSKVVRVMDLKSTFFAPTQAAPQAESPPTETPEETRAKFLREHPFTEE